MVPDNFDRSRLSAREGEILDLAVDGFTDQQIALKLEISTSTVNSYWVRIRGKLGHLSRTELVANALKQQAMRREREHEEQLRDLHKFRDRQEILSAVYERAEMYHSALEAMPEAVLVADESGNVVYNNARLEWLFGYDCHELLGRHVSDLCRQIDEYLANPHPLRLGVDQVIYGQRKDGSLMRLIILLDSRPTTSGSVTTCIVRAFLNEVDTLRSHVVSYGRTL